MQTHGSLFSNSFSTSIGQQIQMDTSWLRLRQQKFSDIGNSIFLQGRSSTAAKSSEGFPPNLLFSLNNREQQGFKKSSTSCENSQNYKITSSQSHGSSRKGNSLSRQCHFQKILSLPSRGDTHKRSFQEDVPITIK